MSYIINKTLSGDFPNGIVAGKVQTDIQTSVISSASIESITTNQDDDSCVFTFDVEPSPADKTNLDNLIASYVYAHFFIDPVLSMVIDEHFMISNINANEIGVNNWTKTKIGVNSNINKKTFPGRPGNVQLVAGQEANGTTAIHIGTSTDGLAFETGTYNKIELEAYFTIENTVSSSDFEFFLIGFSDDNDTFGKPLNAGVIFFDPTENANLQMKTFVSGVETSIVTSTVVEAGKWYRVKIIYCDLATNPTMAIMVNDDVESMMNFTMPTVSIPFSPTIKIDGKNGSNLAKLSVDYFLMKEDYDYN